MLKRCVVALVAATGAGLGSTPLRAQDGAPERVAARVSGVVFDSLSGRPLAGATVQLVAARAANQARSLDTGNDGAFHFDSIEVGTYLLGFYHPLLDSLGISTPLTRIDVRVSGEVRAPLAVPSPSTLIASFCGPNAQRDSLGALLGFVRSASSGQGLPTSQVRVAWAQFSVGARGLERTTPSMEATTSEHGGVAMCGLPRNATVSARAWNGSDSSGFAELEIPAHGLVRRDLFIGSVRQRPVAAAMDDSTGSISDAPRGAGSLRGVVLRSDGAPVAGARLRFWGNEVTTSETGAYRLDSIPTGTHTLEARALGYLPYRRTVDVLEGAEPVADVRLEAFSTFLDTVKVTAERLYISPQLKEFESRRKSGFGHFLDEDAISRRNPIYMSDLFRTVPGVTIASSGGIGNRVLMRASGMRAYCAPAVFVDGARTYTNDGDLDMLVSAQDVRAVEIYTRGSSVPVQFQTLEGCGSLVIWTGGRRPTASK